ncbi:MAG: type I DNA topoisomerase [Patescibacteria group bacterium]
MNLVIVESPTKAKTINKYLGRDYSVKSSYGHIRDLPEKKFGVDLKHDFKPEYTILVKAKKIVKELRQVAQKAKLIILATDEDREGEAIAWHILQTLDSDKIKNYQRIVFHEITKKAIDQALKNPRQIDMDLVNAQQARRILDRIVGYKLSPFLWKKVVKGLSAGRVQSVAVRLIVDREREIEAFKPEEYWSIEAQLRPNTVIASEAKQSRREHGIATSPSAPRNDNNEFTAKLIRKDEKTINKLGVKDKEWANQILKDLEGAQYQVSEIKKRQVQKQPSPPFATSTLQQEASRKLGFSAKQTMRIAQQLYEGIELGPKGSFGLITYHRTDSLNISQEAITKAREFIKEQFGKNYLPAQARIYKTKAKSAQEAHEAVRPTQISRQPEKIKQFLDKNQYKLYDLIWRRFMACQMNPALLDATSVDIKAGNYTFRSTGSIIKFDGWLKIYPSKIKENILPDLIKQEILKLIKLLSEQHFTEGPARYNEASLVKTLEEYGIGRPSTYAPIISTIQDRGYVGKDEQKRFIPSEIGLIVTDLLKENFSQIVDIKFTAYLEKDLDRIADGKQNWLDVLNDFYQPFQKNLDEKYEQVKKKKLEEPTDKKCPQCGKNLVIKLGRFGKFYACPGFPDCKYTEPIINSTGVQCPQCGKGEIIERKTKKGKTFYSCSQFPECKYALWDKPIQEKCPRCNSLLVETKSKKIKCSNKECGYQTKEKE